MARLSRLPTRVRDPEVMASVHGVGNVFTTEPKTFRKLTRTCGTTPQAKNFVARRALAAIG